MLQNAQKAISQNGQDKTATPGAKILTVAPKETPKKEKEELKPLEDRLHRLNELFALQTKYNRLQQSKANLSEFTLKSDAENVTLELSDYNNRGKSFSTKNPIVIKEVLEFVISTIDKKMKEIEPKLVW